MWRRMPARERLADVCFKREGTSIWKDDRRRRSYSPSAEMRRKCSTSCKLGRDRRDWWNVQKLGRWGRRDKPTSY